MTTVWVGEEAFERLAALWTSSQRGPAVVVMDSNTREAAGAALVTALRGECGDVQELVFDERSGLRPTPEAVRRVQSKLPANAVPVAVGSGVITDIVRYAAHLTDRDFLSVATAASMDGYASSMAALERDGVKVTYPARAPEAIFADPRVLVRAPAELTRAGLGDLLGKATARVDWLAAHLLYGEILDQRAAALVAEALAFAAEHAREVLAGDAAAVRALFDGLVRSGQAMAMAGSSRPASGCEHHASHFWDLLASRALRAHASHGLQVGYATRFATRLQRFAIDLPAVRQPVPVADPLGPETREWLGEPTAEIRAAVEEKARFSARLGRWPADVTGWEQVRERIRPALEVFGDVDSALADAGIPSEPGFLELDRRTLVATFRHSTRLRARYTSVDLLEGQGLLNEAIEAVLN